ncbi:MAG: TIGR00730 family Rossman fold protein, partial [Phycisphaerales bacterium]
MRSIAIFCASSDGADPAFIESARQVGRSLAHRGIAVVYGGGRIGLMGAVADGALGAGGRVIGVIPRAMVQAERAHTGVSDLRIVDSMHERKALMADLADGFIALPGGYGTFDELFEIITWGQLAFHVKPVGILNVRNFYGPLLAFL